VKVAQHDACNHIIGAVRPHRRQHQVTFRNFHLDEEPSERSSFYATLFEIRIANLSPTFAIRTRKFGLPFRFHHRRLSSPDSNSALSRSATNIFSKD
jgi:hypothetical protein